MTDSPVRVRIAPSPSGYVHVGTARTAVFNYLFARHYGGRFLVRIEDTDKERSDPKFIEAILDAFRWLGLSWDDEIIYQSQRVDKHREYSARILEGGAGYCCFCTSEQLQEDREQAKAAKGPMRYNRRCLDLSPQEVQQKLRSGLPYTIRLRIPDGETRYHDMVSGELIRQNAEIEDFIIARSDGTAVYNMAVVADDHDMGITHVIRGNDHVTNTFKQIHIYRALGWPLPRFAHVPLILRPDKKKVSKRLGDKDVVAYRDEGILPQAMFNFLTLLGWSPKTDREIYTPEELIGLFTEDNFNASNATFDPEKLVAFNREHIALMSDHDLAALVAPRLVAAGVTSKYWLETRWDYLRAVVAMLKSRAGTLDDIVERGGYFFTFDGRYDQEAAAKHFGREVQGQLKSLADRLEALDDFTHDRVEAELSSLAGELGVKKGNLIHPTRLAVSGMPVGPSLFEMLELLGQKTVVDRLRRACEYVEANYH
ncbi:MAG: glutamate--tRNA ligase [bacterium]